MRDLAKGDIRALGDLYQRYGALVAHAVISACPTLPRDEVEEVCQDVFIAVAGAAPRYQESGKLRSWIYSVAARTARKHRRSISLHEKLLRSLKGFPVAISPPRSLPASDSMSRIDLDTGLGALTEVQRQVLILFELEGMSGEEVSELLSIRLNTVWSHLRRARERLVKALDGALPEKGVRT